MELTKGLQESASVADPYRPSPLALSFLTCAQDRGDQGNLWSPFGPSLIIFIWIEQTCSFLTFLYMQLFVSFVEPAFVFTSACSYGIFAQQLFRICLNLSLSSRHRITAWHQHNRLLNITKLHHIILSSQHHQKFDGSKEYLWITYTHDVRRSAHYICLDLTM